MSKFLLTDNGMEFVNSDVARGRARDIPHDYSAIPATGQSGRARQSDIKDHDSCLFRKINRFENHMEWNKHLRDFRFAYTTAFHSSIGTSPAFLNFGWESAPINWIHE